MKRQANVMVVDDDPPMTSTLAKILGAEGHSVVTEQSGNAALAILQQDCPDLVLSDLKMDGMSGHELQAEIARHNPDLPIVIITAFGSIESAVESMRRGAIDFIMKPFTSRQLKIVVERALEQQELGRPVQHLRSELACGYAVEHIISGCPQM